jgi:hypothetical protein
MSVAVGLWVVLAVLCHALAGVLVDAVDREGR